MEVSQIYIFIAIIVLLIIAIAIFFIKNNKKQERLTPLAAIAFSFVLAGIIFSDNRLVGYILMGVGILLAMIDIIIKIRKNEKK